MIKQKVENPKEDIEEEIKKQKDKFKRIREAYINEVFTLEEYDLERKKVENTLEELETKLTETEICDELKFTPEDILIKRDIDFINSIKYPQKYKEYNKRWKDFTREEKSNLIMSYVDEITLTESSSNKCEVEYVKFRESIANPCNELYDKGYIDRTDYALFGNMVGTKNNKVKDKQIKDLKEENLSLRQSLSFWKDKFLKIISFIKDKLFGKEKERKKYMDVAEDLYSKKIIEEDTFEDLQDTYEFSKNHDYEREKDDFDMQI